MLKEISRFSSIQQVPDFTPNQRCKSSSLQNPSYLSSLKGNEEGILTKVWSYTKKGWNAIYSVFEKVLSWIFCQCFYKDETASMDPLFLAFFNLKKGKFSIEEKVKIYEKFPKEVLAKVSEFCNQDGKKGSKEIINDHLDVIEKVIDQYLKKIAISIFQNLLDQAGSEEKNISLVGNVPLFVRDAICSELKSFSGDKFKKTLKDLIAEGEKFDAS